MRRTMRGGRGGQVMRGGGGDKRQRRWSQRIYSFLRGACTAFGAVLGGVGVRWCGCGKKEGGDKGKRNEL